jgi:hypothetical protein
MRIQNAHVVITFAHLTRDQAPAVVYILWQPQPLAYYILDTTCTRKRLLTAI